MIATAAIIALSFAGGFFLGFLLACVMTAGSDADDQMNRLSAEFERMRNAQQ